MQPVTGLNEMNVYGSLCYAAGTVCAGTADKEYLKFPSDKP